MTTPELAGADWRKSSRSNPQGGDCVEVTAVPWRKSSRSNAEGGSCVEAASVVR
ncbi:DUF397 domain-containing protein [Actinoallomurus sp. NPDC052274]|uniref:DUF397 domain-containing protein n=1 Tax=Actinoallomurus sp. NPDC052274 TaxID=3155420 RepID=UPI003431BB37